MTEISERYVEQFTTTIETLRRRVIAYYDGIFYLGRKVEKAAERLKEVAEPAAYDARDYVNQSLAENSPLEVIDTETKNSLVEMYLGISVILIGLAGGQLSGAYALTPLIQYVFDTSVVSLILAALPVYIYYSIRKNSSLDDTERRSILFSSTLFFGIFSGYLFGPRMLSLAPTTIFLPPFMFALLFDNGILPTPLVSLNRQSFFIAFASISVFITTFLASIVLGSFSIVISLFNIVHVTGLYIHFQVIMQFVKDKNFLVGESQAIYIGVSILSQFIFTMVLGYNPEATKK
ncbi:uncharacterized protein CELE_W06D4.2 [Caenorhabditis elegans]|uniref:Integral membrane protein n=1 Tax=Caenorhabditis elegans TaxID=6239 RepID=Q9XW44_CAEEL|nr:Integral membrane protein [Caenorhabditis elegans]CAA22250.2 Integral membrane protein [Caenorhabditis elegans]|eukprot:NP_492434.2 Uncharacterized protein CELE_W06D4.2 [Caenorhabditis elegans]